MSDNEWFGFNGARYVLEEENERREEARVIWVVGLAHDVVYLSVLHEAEHAVQVDGCFGVFVIGFIMVHDRLEEWGDIT